MAAKLGANDAAFRLGNQAVSVYLGTVEVYTPVSTLYFNDAEEDGDWATLGNWWLDQGQTVPATALPGPGNDVVIAGIVSLNSGSPITVRNFEGPGSAVGINFTATGLANFYANFSGTLTGNAAFNDSSFNAGTVTGNATFNDSSFNGGTVTGNATFNGIATNQGTVTGTATFNDSAVNCGGTAGTFVPDPPPSC